MAMGGRRGMAPERRAEMMQRRLGLNADQTTQIKAIMVDGQAKMKALHQDQMAKIRAILTPEQVKKLDTMQARMRGRRGGMGGDGPPPPPPPAAAPQS